MGRATVTGVAGFIGSHLGEALIQEGWEVVGVDSFAPYYDPVRKRGNVEALSTSPRFRLVEADLVSSELRPLIEGSDVVFHLAAQPGVRDSWRDFDRYVASNVIATERLLRASSEVGVSQLVFASSSSVYGDRAVESPDEETALEPVSPYGVTKAAGEHLVNAYARATGLVAATLRYFTVFGPRQRPDMAIQRMFAAVTGGEPFPVYGDGSQIRSFTYVGDVVRATIAVAEARSSGAFNIAGPTAVSVGDVIEVVESVTGTALPLVPAGPQAGDVQGTRGLAARAGALLGWKAEVTLREGLEEQWRWWQNAEPARGPR